MRMRFQCFIDVACLQENEPAFQHQAVVKLLVVEPSQPEDAPAAMSAQEAGTSPAQHAASAATGMTATVSSLSSFLEGLMPAAALALTSSAAPSSKNAAVVPPTASLSDRHDKTGETSQTPVSGADVMQPVQLSMAVVEDALGEEQAATVSRKEAATGEPQESAACAERPRMHVSADRPVRGALQTVWRGVPGHKEESLQVTVHVRHLYRLGACH